MWGGVKVSNNKCLGFIETFGLAACVAAADAAVKSANVKLLGYEYAKGGGMCTVKVEGNVGACRAAIAAGKKMPATKIEASLLLPRIWYALQIYNIFKQSQQQHENKFIKMQLYTLIYENSLIEQKLKAGFP